MDIKLAVIVFGVVFLGASLALVATSAIGVLAGGLVAQDVSPRLLSYVTGAGFILIGAWAIGQAAVAD